VSLPVWQSAGAGGPGSTRQALVVR